MRRPSGDRWDGRAPRSSYYFPVVDEMFSIRYDYRESP